MSKFMHQIMVSEPNVEKISETKRKIKETVECCSNKNCFHPDVSSGFKQSNMVTVV